MRYRLAPAKPTQHEIRRVAIGCADDALGRLASLHDATPDAAADEVHEIRKRCKELRGLSRLIEPTLGGEFNRVDRRIRNAARELSSARDAVAALAALRGLADHGKGSRAVSDAIANLEGPADPIPSGNAIRGATRRLEKARRFYATVKLPRGFDPLADGLTRTYRRGRRTLRVADASDDDSDLHELRKDVKYLWYQMRLLRGAAPSMLDPLVAVLDQLGEDLGDHQDLSVLVGLARRRPASFGRRRTAKGVVEVARSRMDELRQQTLRQARTVYAERPRALAERVSAYWAIAIEHGPEPRRR